MEPLSAFLYVAAFLLAVVDGIRADKGTYPSDPGPTGIKLFWRKHPWIVVGAICGVAAVVIDFAAS